MKVSFMFARFPFLACDHPDTTDWLIQTVRKADKDPRIDFIVPNREDDTPITATRNMTVKKALKAGVDYLLMLDSDMSPDIQVPGCKPFWDTSLDFLLSHRDEITTVCAPYCGPPPHSNVYMFRWGNWQNGDIDQGMKLDQYTREEAAQMTGICEVAASPTGLMIIDMRAFKHLEPPWFYYEWKDSTESEKASTEDVTFTRDLSMQGIRQYCNWDAWAGHWKRFRVDKPIPINVDQVRDKFVRAVKAGIKSDTKFTILPKQNGSFGGRLNFRLKEPVNGG